MMPHPIEMEQNNGTDNRIVIQRIYRNCGALSRIISGFINWKVFDLA
jgi:hypothetical protein